MFQAPLVTGCYVLPVQLQKPHVGILVFGQSTALLPIVLYAPVTSNLVTALVVITMDRQSKDGLFHHLVTAPPHMATKCIFVDNASGWIYHRAQKSLAASDTIRSKLLLKREAADVGNSIRAIHTDNGVFNSKEFWEHCKNRKQKLTFSAVGAKHQNAFAENAIHTVCYMARANTIHATIRWPEYSLLSFWPQAMSYAIWVHNRLPPHGNGLSPEEVWSGLKNNRSKLPRAHIFGCPVYVLDPALQDDKKIPKWDSRA
jgi:hypothetical protein